MFLFHTPFSCFILVRFEHSLCTTHLTNISSWRRKTNDCHLTHGINLDYRKTFLVINFLRLIHSEIIHQGIHLCAPQREQGSVPQETGSGTLYAREMTNKIEAQFQCRHLQEGRRLWVLQYRWISRRIPWSDSKDSKYRNCNSTNSRIHNHFLVWKIRFQNQVTTCSDFPSDATLWVKEVEKVESVEELKSSRSVSGNNFPNFEMLDAKTASEHDHPEFTSQEEGQSQGTESPERGPFSTRKTDRLHDQRLFSGNWRSWYRIGLCCFILCYSPNWRRSGIRYKMARNSLPMSKIPSDEILESL